MSLQVLHHGSPRTVRSIYVGVRHSCENGPNKVSGPMSISVRQGQIRKSNTYDLTVNKGVSGMPSPRPGIYIFPDKDEATSSILVSPTSGVRVSDGFLTRNTPWSKLNGPSILRPQAGSALAALSVTVQHAMKNTRNTPQQYLTIIDAARFCGVSTKSLRRAARSRRLAYFKPAGVYLFALTDLEAYMDASRFGVVVFGMAV